jgi:hypothetical protein
MKPLTRKLIGLGAAGSILLAVVLGMWFLAATTPASPGDLLFGAQSVAENTQIALARDPAVRSRMSFAQVERRLADIIMAKGEKELAASVTALNTSLNKAVVRIEDVAEADRESLYTDAKLLLARAELVLEALDKKVDSVALKALEEKVELLTKATTPLEMQEIVRTEEEKKALGFKQIISFLGRDVDHANFELVGGHAELACSSCHATGVYKGTATDCATCHTLEGELVNLQEVYGTQVTAAGYDTLQLHYEGACSDCHHVGSWEPYQFLHQAELVECISCHAEDLPEEKEDAVVWDVSRMISQLAPEMADKTFKGEQLHWPGDCLLCHTDLTDWNVITFDHTVEEAADCATCHAFDGHENEYPGDCTTCHTNTEEWLDMQVDHTEYRECLDCHADDDKPEGHFMGDCASCHSDEFWTPAFFDHTRDMDCASCHTAPSAHTYTGQCITCHTMDSWGNDAEFHANLSCYSCHEAPKGHYTEQCSSCHETASWVAIDVNHTALLSCNTCHLDDTVATSHYPGTCSNCHVTDDWLNYDFNHNGFTDCASCHKAPTALHFNGIQCDVCHITGNWYQLRVDHTQLSPDCTTCHAEPVRHWPGECTLCHTTYSWWHIIYEHSDNDNCLECHAKPDGHWSGQCSRCHVTTTWSFVNFDHTGYTDCKSCHNRPDNHPRGQCSNCHTTDTWLISTSTAGTSAVTIIVTPAPLPTPIFSIAP